MPTLSEIADNMGTGRRSGNRTLVAVHRGEVAAMAVLVDPLPVKANVVLRMPLVLSAAVRLLAGLSRVWPGWDPPRTGVPLRILFVRPIAYLAGHEKAAAALIRRARVLAFREGFTFLATGLHDADPLRGVVRFFPRLTFRAEGFVLSLRGPHDGALEQGVPVEDFALV